MFNNINDIFRGGEMAARINAFDWCQTPLGAIKDWSQSLKSLVKTLLTSRYPMVLTWGPEFTQFYNDAYSQLIGDKHPAALGIDIRIALAEAWDTLGPMIETVMSTGVANWTPALLLVLERSGYREESYFSVSHAPAEDDSGQIVGMLAVCSEVTQQVLGDRRLRLLRDLASKVGQTQSVEATCLQAIAAIALHPMDVPFALLYLREGDGKTLTLRGAVGLQALEGASPHSVVVTDDNDIWSLADAARGETVLMEAVDRYTTVLGGPWSEPVRSALVMPIASSGQTAPLGVIVVGISPNRALDEGYRSFYELLIGQVSILIRNAQAYEEERKRAEALAELDRAKTTFFSNISHEFRTPLTLMLGPAVDALNDTEAPLPSRQRERIEILHRNGLRLLKLVNTLLNFSRIEADRIQANYEPTDLSNYTAELASLFRSAIEAAEMHLTIDCPPLPEPVYVDRDMWEKIVFNLLSNAFKFTFEGEIAVSLCWQENQVQLTVSDTGIGIPQVELPRLFERFYRVESRRGRTYEGSGIGLSLVQELVRLHGGTIDVASVVEGGTTFTITIPTGCAHLPSERLRSSEAERINVNSTQTSTALGASAYIEEAWRWLPQEEGERGGQGEGEKYFPHSPTPRILLVDDNADMRDYIQRLLGDRYTIEAVADGYSALAAVRRQVPDLVLSDVMMPGLDGIGLVQALRADSQTKEVPIILLSARAGEESRVEGLQRGSNDYLIKPFSARELLARVETNLQLGQLRQQARRESEDRLRLAIESAELGTWDFNPITRTLKWDEHCKAMFGLPSDVLISYEVFLAGLHPDDRDRLHEVVQWAINPNSGGKLDVEYRTIGIEDGVERWIAAKGQTYFNQAGEAVRLIGTVLNITKKKRVEAEREQLLARERVAREQAEAANRIKDEFLAVLSHELRTPLNPILGWTKLLKGGRCDAMKTQQALDTIERNAQLQIQLIEDLLDVSRILQGKLTVSVSSVDLSTVIINAIDTVRLAANVKSIDLQYKILDFGLGDSSENLKSAFPDSCLETSQSPKIQVMGDAARLQQVIWNLLSNAVKFTPNCGQIQVALSKVEQAETTLAQITVRDTGIGIHPEFLPYVFEYFRQEDSSTTRKFGGLGLGLAIARQIVELHGGTIHVYSSGEAQGTTFTVSLPIPKPQITQLPTPSISSNQMPIPAPLKGLQILIVDDELDSLELISFVLQQNGATVTNTTSVSEALKALTKTNYNLLISDIGMPEIDGYQFIRLLRTLPLDRGGQIPAIALTAYAGEYDRKQALQAGFQRHITKPIDPNEIVKAIAMVIGHEERSN
ncbi:histidine kinase [Scytonema hofmannii PCC 7110]|uniref:histidine kinase n=1 Tax=Scytonema hofmannii PCC 7110 TaxID=128403 RepID=A0A139WSK6_9CYAN|nr:ATP-binding protein [Scytonema hofmannii]KYC35424.1 histidine kinase [Scytonema hofmannii PCC 7110]